MSAHLKNEVGFRDQVAVITGAGEGIGYEIARQLALKGVSVILNDINVERVKQAAGEISAEGGKCIGTGGDVANADDVRGLVSLAVEKFGRLDIAVANAGISFYDDFFDVTPENFNRVVSTNLGGTFFLAQASARQMRAQGSGGRILCMSSVLGSRAAPEAAVYGMTKRGIEMLTRNLGVSLAPYKITVNALAPGATVTPRTLHDDPDYEAHWKAVTPTGRPAYPMDIAQAALFFLAPETSHITGQTLLVDGGWTITSPWP
jgi:3-oxoacyl-[acyl-carrier protein] reductase